MTAALRCLSLLAMVAAASAAEKPAWEFAERKSGQRVAFTKLSGKGPGGALDATLVFSRTSDAQRKPVRKGNATTPPLVIELWLANAKQAAPFDFSDYEGPDASSGSTKLVTVTVTTKGKPWTRKWTASGWFSPLRDPTGGSREHRAAGEPEAFVFGLGDVLKDYRDLMQFADSLAGGADALTIEVAGKAKGAPALCLEVPLAGASEAIGRLMAAAR